MLAEALAGKARRQALVAVLRRCSAITLGELDELIEVGEFGSVLGRVTVAEILGLAADRAPLAMDSEGDTPTCLLSIFRGSPTQWFASSFFVRHVGLKRWVVQGALGELVASGEIERSGKTSATRYRLTGGSGNSSD